MFSIELETVKKSFNRLLKWFWVIAIVILGYVVLTSGSEKWNNHQTVKKDAICPSLLSISRSARDTFLVMKAEPLCNTFVLENLK
jgi:hypothetical protein